MALDEVAALNRIREIVAGIDGMRRAYSAGERGDFAIPSAIGEVPAAQVLPGDTLDYVLTQPHHRHTFRVIVQVLVANTAYGNAIAEAVQWRTKLLQAFPGYVSAAEWNSCRLAPPMQFRRFTVGGTDYIGWELSLEVSQQSLTSAGYGG